MLLSMLTYDELEFLVTSEVYGLCIIIILGLIYCLIARTDFERSWEKYQIEQDEMLTYVKKRFGVRGNLTCGKIDGVRWFIYKNDYKNDNKYVGIYDSEEDTLIK